MIKEFNYPNRTWELFITNVDLDYYLIFIKIFEELTHPKEKVLSFWHDTTSEFILEKFPNNKIRIEYFEEIVTIMFTETSDDISKKALKSIAEKVEQKMIEGHPLGRI